MKEAEFEEMLVHIHALLNEVMTEGPKKPDLVLTMWSWRFTLDGKPDSPIAIGQAVENHVFWISSSVSTWIASLKNYPAIEAALADAPHLIAIAKEQQKGPDNFAESLRYQVQLCVRDFVADSFEPDTWAISQPRLAEAVETWRAMLVKGQSTHRLLMFLHGVVVDGACDLDGLRLRKPEYVESLAAFRWRMGPGPNAEILSAGVVLDGVECVAFGTPSVLADRASAALTALRIWTRRPITSLATFRAERRNVFRGSMLPASRVSWFGRGEPLADVAGFVNFWRRTREVIFRPPDALGVALRRVDLMVEQERQADRVLDLCIILEALFQRGDEKQELGYRLRLRTAHFVGTSKQSRQEIFETVRGGATHCAQKLRMVTVSAGPTRLRRKSSKRSSSLCSSSIASVRRRSPTRLRTRQSSMS